MLFEVSEAVLSYCKQYRYVLTRQWNPDLPDVVFVMLNPSVADAQINDPTIRRCIGFAKSWGYGGIKVVNLFAWRATKPIELKSASDPVGPDNDKFLLKTLTSSAVTVIAWGAMAPSSRVMDVLTLMQDAGVVPYCLGATQAGHPRHPLYVPKVTRLQLYHSVDYYNEEA